MFCKNCGKEIKIGAKFCDNCGQEIKISKFVILRDRMFLFYKNHKKGVIIALIILFFLIIIILIDSSSDSSIDDNQYLNNNATYQPTSDSYKQNGIASSVVNIFCDNDGGGSGTIRTEDGLILTNNHVISGSSFCLVSIPDETTGQAIEIYKAEPIIVPYLSDQYDIAGLSIYDFYTDDDGKKWGVYPAVFPSFSTPGICDNYSPSLGERITIYGYPVTSGGYNLTVTDGVISSFADDGTILTSAKIDSGNSGGLAVNQNGCFVGIPSAVVNGNYQNLGVIISQSLIDEFLTQIPND